MASAVRLISLWATTPMTLYAATLDGESACEAAGVITHGAWTELDEFCKTLRAAP